MKLTLTSRTPAASPRQGLWRWLMALGQSTASPASPNLPGATHHPVSSTHPPITPPAPIANSPSVTLPLKVVRVLDADQSPSQVGRMLISGRMVDVCAELDRLAARELTLRY